MLSISLTLGLALLASPAAAASARPADLVVRNAVVYTVDPAQPWAQAVAIRDRRILVVGSDEVALRWVGAETRVIDAGGRLVLPAFGDAHIHPVMGGLGLAQCSMHDGESVEEYLQIVRDCIAASPGNGVLYGGGWRPGLFLPDGVPTKYALDEISPDRALVFRSIGGHSLWVNSKAMEMAGITRETPDPPNGRIDRDPETGEPNGGLQESARDLVMAHVPPPSVADMQAAIVRSVDHLHELGVTYWLDAGVAIEPDGSSGMLDAYAAARASGALRMHVALSLKWDNERGVEQLPVLLAVSQRAEVLGFGARSVKMYLDGVIAQRTAAMLEPYSDSAEERGATQVPDQVFTQSVIELDRRGFQVYVHAIGDRATRTALDAFEVARARNGQRDNRHMITHLNVINPSDQPRFGQLGITANFQPLWAERDDYMEMTAVRVGPERMQQIYPAASLLRGGARLAYGADWPVDSANPFAGIEVALTRLSPTESGREALLADEGVTLEQAIHAYTQNVAIVAGLEDRTGSLTPGKSADLILVDRNIFEVPAQEISDTRVLLTLYEGEVVHEADGAVAATGAEAEAFAAAMNGSERCAALNGFQPSQPARITAAEWIVASAEQPWRSPEGFRDPAMVRVPFCRLVGDIPTPAEARIRFELWLPAAANWNGRFFGTASGGSLGAIQYAALTMPLERGFAALGHDNGHESANLYEQSWALDAAIGKVARERLIDFASRAQHLATVVAKEAVAAYYGSPVHYAYYVGCSQGGHHGMMEAQRYPEDYDGIVAGAHGGSWTEMVAGEAWAAFQVTRNDGAGALSKSLATVVSRRAIEHCDADDGLEDGLIADPRRCRFDPALMQCGTSLADPTVCLTSDQVEATRAIYAGPHTADGRQLAPGFAPGSEQYWRWTDEHEYMSGSYYDFYRLLVHQDPSWDFLSMDWERDIDRGKVRLGPVFDAVDPDLSRFREAGGRLIMYHGWSDPLISPFLSVDTWDAINERMGAAETAEVARLFMISGMAHCGDGPIGGTRDLHDEAWLVAIQRWVEEGIPPDGKSPESTVVGVGAAGGTLRTRPYCPYPGHARYLGSGSIDRAANFICESP